MSTELNQGSSSRTPYRSTLGNGHFTAGKWYCGCNEAAVFRLVTRESCNNGKRFWRCPRLPKDLYKNKNKETGEESPEEPQKTQCKFYIWEEDEDIAKERLGQHPLRPQTPTRKGGRSSDSSQSTLADSREPLTLPQSPETPCANRKRKANSRLDDYFNNHSSGAAERAEALQSAISLEDATAEAHQPPERLMKAARTLTFSTPGGQRHAENPNDGSDSLPTPNTHGHRASASRLSPALFLRRLDSSPMPGRSSQRPIVIDPEDRMDLAATILRLVGAEKPDLRRSTEHQIRLEIDLALEVAEVKLRRFKETISLLYDDVDMLKRKVDRLEAAAED